MSRLTELISDIKDTIFEINNLIPDSILFGSVLMYFLTLNKSFGVFGLFMLEMVLSHRIISWIFSQSLGPSRSVNIPCRAGFKTPQYRFYRIFAHDSYPSYSIFSLTAIISYLGLSNNEFSSTLDSLGPEWAGRKFVSFLFSIFILVAFLIIRFITCEPVSEMFVSFILGIFIGYLLFKFNKLVFGLEGINFLGLPYLVSKDTQGSPIYVCVKKDESKKT